MQKKSCSEYIGTRSDYRTMIFFNFIFSKYNRSNIRKVKGIILQTVKQLLIPYVLYTLGMMLMTNKNSLKRLTCIGVASACSLSA